MNKATYYLLILILIMGLLANWVIQKASSSHHIPIIKPVPEFSFINHNGKKFTDKNLLNKITVLDFIFTSCTGPCPMMSLNMFELYNNFDNVNEVQFVSITVDPDIDTKEKLMEYSNLLGVNDERWHFLRSKIAEVKELKQNGFMLYADNLPQGHAIKFVLIDHEGNIRKYFDGTDGASQDILRKDIKRLVKKVRL